MTGQIDRMALRSMSNADNVDEHNRTENSGAADGSKDDGGLDDTLGMRTVWINTGEPFSLLGSKGDHIDWVSPDLSLWLEAYLAHLDTAGQNRSAR